MNILHPYRHTFPNQAGLAGVNHGPPAGLKQADRFSREDSRQRQANLLLETCDQVQTAMRRLDNTPQDLNPADGTVVLKSPTDQALSQAVARWSQDGQVTGASLQPDGSLQLKQNFVKLECSRKGNKESLRAWELLNKTQTTVTRSPTSITITECRGGAMLGF